MTQYIKKLPAVFQTVTEKKFFDATFDQVFSKKDSDLLYGFIGQRVPGYYNPVSDFYLPEPSKDRTWWQLEPTAYSKNVDGTRSNIFFYDDLLRKIDYHGGNTLNQDRLFESEFYSWAPPIDYDMFMNYHNYYWVESGLVQIQITGVLASDVIGKTSYVTPETASPANLKLTTGMNVLFVDDTEYTYPVVIENIGGKTGIRLVPHYPDYTTGAILEFLPWDGVIQLPSGRIIRNTNWDILTWDVQPQPGNGDYITIERGSVDRNAWSRTNKWVHIDAISATMQATGTPFPNNASRALRPIIQFSADIKLYKSGDRFKSEVKYLFRDYSPGLPVLLSSLQGKTQTEINTLLQANITDGDLVIFSNDITLNSGISTNELIFETKIDLTTDIVTFIQKERALSGDIVFVTGNAIYNGASRGQTLYFEDKVWKHVENEKTRSNQPPLFQLYDHNGIPLDDPITYPGSTFDGNTIFSYKVNDTPGATVDPVLKFPIVYTALGQSSDIIFNNSLMTDRYQYGTGTYISGYYYYSIYNNSVNYNNWQLHEITDNTGKRQVSPSKQRVIDKYVVGYGTDYQFKLSVVPYGYDLDTGSHHPSADIIVTVNGNEVKSLLEDPAGYFFVEINSRIYVDLQLYITKLMTDEQLVAPVVEISTYTHDMLDPELPGYYEIPQQLKSNPTQDEIFEISASDLISHFSSIIENQDGIVGTPFGGTNNYRDTLKNGSLGSFILQNISPAIKSMLVSSDKDIDIIQAVRFSQDEYTKFKNKFLSTAKQLIDQEFSPVQHHNNTIIISAWVDEILKVVNVSKEFSDAFSYSCMVAAGVSYLNETHTVPASHTIVLSNYIDLSNPKNSIYVYDISGHEKLLTIGIDYNIISTNLSIELQFSDSLEDKNVYIAFYKNPLPTYIPSTPTKTGTYCTYIPRIELDTSYTIPTNVIIGHDGSKTIAFGDYRDSLLLELEIRIYNLIQDKFRNEYSPPVILEDVKPGYFRKTRYTWDEYLRITESYINKWSAKNKANYRVNDWELAIADLPINSPELWKLYNYSDAVTPSGQRINMPGNWKGIYQYLYDTIYPNTRPWEMLGFKSQPVWWISQYGTNWTPSNTQLWSDLELGIIRQGPSAVYDVDTLEPLPNPLWARPGLSNIIPVDNNGNIRPILDVNNISNSLFNIAYSGNMYSPFDGFDAPWAYGDGAPVEQAWMSTSGYAFSIQEFLFLMQPSKYGERMFDTAGTEFSQGTMHIPGISGKVKINTNYQYVQNDVYTLTDSESVWMRPKNSTQIVHGETIDGSTYMRYGYQCWISDRILFLGKDVGTTFGNKVRSLNVNLANKFAGFTNKDTASVYMESAATIGGTKTSLAIPSTNFDVLLHKGQPIKTYSYSGVIIRALAEGKFVVYGYDLLNSEFTILNRSNAQLIDISIGGVPAEFKIYDLDDTYYPGDIVRYNGVYYSCLVTTTGKFNSDNWKKLKALPVVGGVSVVYRPISEETITKIPYGSVLNSAQEVFDLLIGWGAYLESQGWQFTNISPDTNQISDWLYSAKQFLFWLNTQWAPDASIQLSPAANSATLIVKKGYPDDVEKLSNGVYSILDKYGIAIPTNKTSTDRNGLEISVATTSDDAGGIYFLQINASETEHILIFDNTTSFNDVVYNPLLGARQHRLRFNGFRSNGWYGKKEAPGYIILEDEMVPNYDTIVDAMRYYYDPNVTIDNPSLETLGRHLIGYESKSYLDNLQVSNDVQYLFYQGAIREKGTTQSIEKLFRSTRVRTNESIEVYEEWALRVGNFGNTVEQIVTEFVLEPEQNSGEVVVARLNFNPSEIGSVKDIIILNSENVYKNVPRIIVDPPDYAPEVYTIYSPFSIYNAGDVVSYSNAQKNIGFFRCKNDGTIGHSPSETAYWNLNIQTRTAKAYAVLDSSGKLLRVDITDHGYGYLSAPYIGIDSGKEEHHLDRLYSVWQGAVVKDVSLENIVEIDIDDTDKWIVRPNDPQYSLKFPTTEIIDYKIPNAGYVNYADVDWHIFDLAQLHSAWGSQTMNPVAGDTIWVANNTIQDWNVYKFVDITNAKYMTDKWRITRDDDGNLLLLTSLDTVIVPEGYSVDPEPILIPSPFPDPTPAPIPVNERVTMSPTTTISRGYTVTMIITGGKPGGNFIYSGNTTEPTTSPWPYELTSGVGILDNNGNAYFNVIPVTEDFPAGYSYFEYVFLFPETGNTRIVTFTTLPTTYNELVYSPARVQINAPFSISGSGGKPNTTFTWEFTEYPEDSSITKSGTYRLFELGDFTLSNFIADVPGSYIMKLTFAGSGHVRYVTIVATAVLVYDETLTAPSTVTINAPYTISCTGGKPDSNFEWALDTYPLGSTVPKSGIGVLDRYGSFSMTGLRNDKPGGYGFVFTFEQTGHRENVYIQTVYTEVITAPSEVPIYESARISITGGQPNSTFNWAFSTYPVGSVIPKSGTAAFDSNGNFSASKVFDMIGEYVFSASFAGSSAPKSVSIFAIPAASIPSTDYSLLYNVTAVPTVLDTSTLENIVCPPEVIAGGCFDVSVSNGTPNGKFAWSILSAPEGYSGTTHGQEILDNNGNFTLEKNSSEVAGKYTYVFAFSDTNNVISTDIDVIEVYSNDIKMSTISTSDKYIIPNVYSTDFGNSIVLQEIQTQGVNQANTYITGFRPYTDTNFKNPGVYLSNTTVISSIRATSTFIAETTKNMLINTPIIFEGESIGGVILNKVYYIHSVLSDTEFKISELRNGPAFLPARTEDGFMVASSSTNAYILEKLDGSNVNINDMGGYASFNTLLTFRTMRWYSTPAEPKLPTYVGIGDYIWVDDVAGKWAVIEISAEPGFWDLTLWDPVNTGTVVAPPSVLINFWAQTAYYDYGWDVSGPMYFNPRRIQERLIDTSLFESTRVYSSTSNKELTLLPVYDPFKGILPALAKQNISYMLLQDPARYNVTSDVRLYSENVTFAEEQVGKLWWDLSAVKYVYYEQPALLHSTSGVNIKSITHDDNVATVTTFKKHNLIAGENVIVYNTVPATYNGRYSIKIVDDYTFSYNMQYIPTSDAISVGQYVVGGETQTENLIYRRNNWGKVFPGSTINIYEWVKSDVPPAEYKGSGTPKTTTDYVQVLVTNRFTNTTDTKYYFWVLNPSVKPTIESRTIAASEVSRLLLSPKSQGFVFFAPLQQTATNNSYMFYNVQEILAYQGNNVQIQYRLAERNDQKHAQWAFFREGDKNCLIPNQFWDKLTDSITGYTKLLSVSDEWTKGILIADFLPWDIYGWDVAPWDNATEFTTPIYGETLPVPDPSLSVAESFGVGYRPRQGMFVNINAARKVFVQAANLLLSNIPIRDNNPVWNTNVSTDTYWEYSDWYATGFSNAVPSVVFSTLEDANDALIAGKLSTGTIVEVLHGTSDGRYMMYNVVQIDNITQSLECICIEASAIKLLESIYTTDNSYKLAAELRELLNAFRTQIFVNENLVDQNELYFSMLNYVFSEQKTPNWAFKSSYIYVKENNIPLTKSNFYVPDQLDDVIKYITDSKPYHTQIRDYTSVHTVSDLAAGSVHDTITYKEVLQFGPDFGGPYRPGGWDACCDNSDYPQHWDSVSWDVCPENYAYIVDPITQLPWDMYPWDYKGEQPWDKYTVAEQLISKEESFTVELTTFDPLKKGYSDLYPYTFALDVLNINNPQTFITPANVVSISVDDMTLVYGKDYFVEYNEIDNNYTAYFYNNPGTSTPIANVLWDGGRLQRFRYSTNRTEIAYGVAADNFVVTVNTRLPVNNVNGVYYPLAPWGSTTNSVDPYVASIIESYGGIATYDPNAPVNISLLPNFIRYKHSAGLGHNYLYRDPVSMSSTLLTDLPAPTQDTENLDNIIILCASDILPNPTNADVPAVWINGERIEYKSKIQVNSNTWRLSLVRRGTLGTAPTAHPAQSEVSIEKYNVMPVTANNSVWNAIDVTPDGDSNVTSVSAGGLWYADTEVSEFLKV